MEGLECNKWGEMSVTETIFVRWELVLTNDVYIRNGSGTNIGARLSRWTDLQYLSVHVDMALFITDKDKICKQCNRYALIKRFNKFIFISLMALETSGSLELLSIIWLFMYTSSRFSIKYRFCENQSLYTEKKPPSEKNSGWNNMSPFVEYVLLKENFIRNKKKTNMLFIKI